ncbi:NADP-dependent oxidoreductase [Flagellimonas lutimaris]|uniref:NADP-dependent oxidoreductase n=1 Tax=Flagellimonas lutimaris TaxID=475082 RepID=UPI003F5CE713
MKSISIIVYGGPEELIINPETPVPHVADNQILVENYAAGINPHDMYLRGGFLAPFIGENFPIIPGLDIAGKVIQIGKKVQKFKIGDLVYGMMDSNEKFSRTGFAQSGAYAEFCVTREDTLSLKPEILSFEEAASIPLAALTAYQALRKCNPESGKTILINGASGGVGSMAVQIAKHYGLHVTAVCSEASDSFVTTLKPDSILHYDKIDFTSLKNKYDIIFDVVGNKSFELCQSHLTDNGTYISNVPNEKTFLAYQNPSEAEAYGFNVKNQFNWVLPSGADLEEISRLIEEGIIKPVVHKKFTLEEATSAHTYFDENKVNGKLVLSIKSQ